jgi:hypothetical protein
MRPLHLVTTVSHDEEKHVAVDDMFPPFTQWRFRDEMIVT